MYQNAKYERHREKVILMGKDRKQLLVQRRLGFLNINKKGTYVDDVENYYRCSGVVAATKINISINQLLELSQCWINKMSGRILGADGDLVNTYVGAVFGTMLDDIAKIIRYV